MIRLATASDVKAICVLGHEVSRLHHAAWPSIFSEPGDPLSYELQWLSAVVGQNVATFVAENDERVVGFASVSVFRDFNPALKSQLVARVAAVYVTAHQRGKGIGQRLIAEVESWARDRGVDDIHLSVWAFNEAARRFYEKLGYGVRNHNMGKHVRGVF